MEIFFSLAVASQLLWFLVCGRFLGMPTCHAHTQHSTKLTDLCSSGNQVPWTTQHHCSDWAVWILQEFWRYIAFWLYLLAEIYPWQWRKILILHPWDLKISSPWYLDSCWICHWTGVPLRIWTPSHPICQFDAHWLRHNLPVGLDLGGLIVLG